MMENDRSTDADDEKQLNDRLAAVDRQLQLERELAALDHQLQRRCEMLKITLDLLRQQQQQCQLETELDALRRRQQQPTAENHCQVLGVSCLSDSVYITIRRIQQHVDHEVFDDFVDLRERRDQQHVDHEGHAEVLCRVYKNVSQKLNALSVARNMYHCNTLTLRELLSIRCKWREPIKAAERLLDIVMNKSSSVYEGFLNALKLTGQRAIYESLLITSRKVETELDALHRRRQQTTAEKHRQAKAPASFMDEDGDFLLHSDAFELGGVEACRLMLRKHDEWKNIPPNVISGVSKLSSIDAFESGGVKACRSMLRKHDEWKNIPPNMICNSGVSKLSSVDAFELGGVEACRLMLRKHDEWKNIPPNVISNSGVSKLSFIDAFRPVTADDEGAASVGVKETTVAVENYSHPCNPLLKCWDMPGIGIDPFPRVTYQSDIDLSHFDFSLSITASCFTGNDTWLDNEFHKQNKSYFFVHTKVGVDISNNRKAHPKTCDEDAVARDIRESTNGSLDVSVFPIDTPAKLPLRQERRDNQDTELLSMSPPSSSFFRSSVHQRDTSPPLKVMKMKWVVGISLIIASFLCSPASGETVLFGHGETVHLSCKTSLRNYIQWNYHHLIGGPYVGVYKNGQIDESYDRFSIEYPLIIRNATAEDEGYYSCVEDAGSGRVTVRYHLMHKEHDEATTTTMPMSTTINVMFVSTGVLLSVTLCICCCVLIIWRQMWNRKRQQVKQWKHSDHATREAGRQEWKQSISVDSTEVDLVTMKNLTSPQKSQELELRIQDLERTIQKLVQRIQELELTVQEKEKENESLEQKTKDLEKRVQIMDGDRTELNCLRRKFECLEKETMDENKILNDIKKEQDVLKDQLTCKKVELAQVITDLKHVSERMNEYKAESQKLKAECEQYRSKSVELENQLTEANMYLKCLREDYPLYLSGKQDNAEEPTLDRDYRMPSGAAQKVTDVEDIVESVPTPETDQLQASAQDRDKVMTASFKSIFEHNRVELKEEIKVTDVLLQELQMKKILTWHNVTYIMEVESKDERVERLLAQLEQCNVELLAEFYAALENAGQCEIVKLLRQG